MRGVQVIVAFFLILAPILYLQPPTGQQLCDFFKFAANRANLTINYCFCQDFSHKEYGWRGSLYIAIYTILFFWWFKEFIKAIHRRLLRWELQQRREERQDLRIVRLAAYMHNGYRLDNPERYIVDDDEFSAEGDNDPLNLRRFSRQIFSDDSAPSQRVPEPSFSENYWRSWSAPP